jgi:Cu+-exporting ATPase
MTSCQEAQMNAANTVVHSVPGSWSEEPSKLPDHRKIRVHIGGLHCSLCTGTLEKALGNGEASTRSLSA